MTKEAVFDTEMRCGLSDCGRHFRDGDTAFREKPEILFCESCISIADGVSDRRFVYGSRLL